MDTGVGFNYVDKPLGAEVAFSGLVNNVNRDGSDRGQATVCRVKEVRSGEVRSCGKSGSQEI